MIQDNKVQHDLLIEIYCCSTKTDTVVCFPTTVWLVLVRKCKSVTLMAKQFGGYTCTACFESAMTFAHVTFCSHVVKRES